MKRTRPGIGVAIALIVIQCASLNGAQPGLCIQSGVNVSWPASTGNTYRVQWSPNGGAGSWANLGGPLAGSGMTNSLYDPAPRGVRQYQVLEIVPGSTPSASIPVNGGFELGNEFVATNWSTTSSQRPVRTNLFAHSGSFSMRSALTNVSAAPSEATLSQLVVAEGGTVVGGETYAFSFWARQVTAGPSYIQQYQVQWLNSVGGVVGGSGLVNFNGVIGSWTKLSATNLAPANAVEARVLFRFVTGAVAGGHGEVFIDDVVLDSGGTVAGPGQTNILQATIQPVARISWLTIAGAEYQPESSGALGSGTWTNFLPMIIGDGGTKSFLVPMTRSREFIRLQSPSVVLLPPTNLRVIAAGVTNAIGLAWNASSTPGVIGHRILYGVTSGSLTNSTAVGNVTTATLSGLTPGQTYYLAVVALTADAESQPGNIISAQPQVNTGIVPLFDASTLLEPATTIDTTNALITHVADRARDRHAREGMFSAYDHYLTWYWEERTIAIEIVDRVAKGGTGITFNYTTLTPLGAPEFRAFFRGINTVAEYHFNLLAPLVGSNRYSATINSKLPENRPLQIGDRVEIEISQFIEAAEHGRNNYYGTAILYIVGQGIVPWQGVGPLLDSFPLPESAWLGGLTTLPFQYSNEPEHRFKQTAGNFSPTNAQPFMLGRRLHHTDFGIGAHSESGNPVFTNHIGKLGPKFIARSCVECHVNNGRALPPSIGALMNRTVVKVGSDASGSPHPTLGSVLQPQSIGGPAESSAIIASYTSIDGQYGDGTSYSLQKPNYAFQGTTPSHFSVRIAPPLVGLGLLEAVSEDTILALADPDDADADGVSGRIRTVLDPETGDQRLGRFTSKGGKARLSHQVAAALNTDMGVATAIFPILDGATTNEVPELSAADLDQMTRYVALLGVSARRDLTNAQATQGEQLFTSANCVKCHSPTLTTSAFHPMTELRGQTIRPYTDLLLHDMGPGLADNMGEFDAAGSEWRTPPLWSIGLTAGVSGGEAYLHDGRARTLEEAILWHGGEAVGAKDAFRTMSVSDRAALIKFLKSL
ncbi:MAG TPA: di-heme oxidoredictase family protein [Candidatus Acidoferrum sp.]|nr:di-heme oxidoredictase family protein [Candidatus Acidoferrum sp.]